MADKKFLFTLVIEGDFVVNQNSDFVTIGQTIKFGGFAITDANRIREKFLANPPVGVSPDTLNPLEQIIFYQAEFPAKPASNKGVFTGLANLEAPALDGIYEMYGAMPRLLPDLVADPQDPDIRTNAKVKNIFLKPLVDFIIADHKAELDNIPDPISYTWNIIFLSELNNGAGILHTNSTQGISGVG